MLLRFIVWVVIAYILLKIVGEVIRYFRSLMNPNRHIHTTPKNQKVEKYSNVEDVPYEELSDKK